MTESRLLEVPSESTKCMISGYGGVCMEAENRCSRTGGKSETQASHDKEYILYEWLGKLKWCYLYGHYLVDPQYEGEFVKEHRVY